ncbi:MAG: hypothetical protein ABEL76_01275, partial [Bradymonadaceae bacterium]
AAAEGGGTLEIKNISVVTGGEQTDLVEVQPRGPFQIEPQSDKTLDLKVDIPAGMKRADIPSTVFLEIESTATNVGGQGLKTVTVALQVGAATGPVLEVSKHALTFGKAKVQKTITLKNTGKEALSVTNFQLEKLAGTRAPNDAYGLVLDGTNIGIGENLTPPLNEIAPG